MEVIKVRKQAMAIGKTKHVGALNSYVKSLAKLMKVGKESSFDEKVGNILNGIKKRVTLITDDLKGRVTTTVTTVKASATTAPVGKVCNFLCKIVIYSVLP